jgi:hypothetical protein
MELRIRSGFTLQDYIAFNFFALKKRLIWMPLLLIVLLPVLILAISLINGDPAWLLMLLATFIICILFAGLMTLLNVVSIRSASKKQYRSSKAMQSESDLVVDETGLRESSEFGSTIVLWENVLRAEETPTAYYVFFSRMQALVIVKRLLTPYGEETLRSLIFAHLSAKQNQLKKHG